MQHSVMAAWRETLCRSFPLALVLHVLAGVILLVGVRYWPVAQVVPVPLGLVLDVTEPAPSSSSTVHEPPGLARALLEIPQESRTVPVPAIPGIPDARPSFIPEPAVKSPDPVTGMASVAPDSGALMVAWPQGLTPNREGTSVKGIAAPVAGVGQDRRGQPIALAEILPQYPYGARARGESGRVVIRVHVSASGQVEKVDVVAGSGHPALDNSAVTAAKKAHFRPAEKDGRPVSADMNLQFEFRLEDR